MRLVTLAKIKLNRVGTLSGGGFQSTFSNGSDRIKISTAVLDRNEPELVLAKVRELAIAAGEGKAAVDILQNSGPWAGRAGMNYEFREGHRNPTGTQYGQAYADCEVFPALEIDGRYFRLNEVEHS